MQNNSSKLYANSVIKAREFLRVAPEFRLGGLPTEQTHPASAGLSELARHNLPAALAILKKIAFKCFEIMSGLSEDKPLVMALVNELLWEEEEEG